MMSYYLINRWCRLTSTVHSAALQPTRPAPAGAVGVRLLPGRTQQLRHPVPAAVCRGSRAVQRDGPRHRQHLWPRHRAGCAAAAAAAVAQAPAALPQAGQRRRRGRAAAAAAAAAALNLHCGSRGGCHPDHQAHRCAGPRGLNERCCTCLVLLACLCTPGRPRPPHPPHVYFRPRPQSRWSCSPSAAAPPAPAPCTAPARMRPSPAPPASRCAAGMCLLPAAPRVQRGQLGRLRPHIPARELELGRLARLPCKRHPLHSRRAARRPAAAGRRLRAHV